MFLWLLWLLNNLFNAGFISSNSISFPRANANLRPSSLIVAPSSNIDTKTGSGSLSSFFINVQIQLYIIHIAIFVS